MHSVRRSLTDVQGYTLLAVLWVLVGAASLGMMVSLAGREAVAAAHNRANLTRAAWKAEDCLERARVVIARLLSEEANTPSGWANLADVFDASPLPLIGGCDIAIRAAGATLNINTEDHETIARLLTSIGMPTDRADSLADALIDWRDPDDFPRPHGAETTWYAEHERFTPRNGPFANGRELPRVRGFESVPGLDTLMGVEPGRVALNQAPLAVLAALPGFTMETVLRIAEKRQRGAPLESLLDLAVELSPSGRDSLMSNYGELSRRTVVEPEAWIITSRARVGSPPVVSVIEVRLVRAAERAAIVRRRTWTS